MAELILYPTQKTALENLFSEQPKTLADPSIEVWPLSVSRVEKIKNPLGVRVFEPQSLDGWTIRAAIGKGAFSAPVAGSYTLTLGGDTTEPIAYNANAAAVSTALNALTSVSAAGGVTVTGTGGYFFVTFSDEGNAGEITGDASNLAPLSLIETGTLIAGSVSEKEVQTIRVMQQPAAYAVLSTDSAVASADADILEAGGGGLNAKVRVTLSPLPYDGRWSIVVAGQETALLSYDATQEQVQAALEALSGIGSGNVSVFKETEGSYLFALQGGRANSSVGVVTADGSSLRVLQSKSGLLDMRTPGVQLLLNGAETVQAFLEIEGTPPSGSPQKLFKQAITIVSAILNPSSLSAQPTVFVTEDQVQELIDGSVSGAVLLTRPNGTATKFPIAADTDTARGNALAAAKAAADTGDLITVGPGSYIVTSSLAKDGVNWHFAAGAILTMTTGSSTDGIFNDGATPMTFTVTGAADLVRVGTAGLCTAIRCQQPTSKISVQCRDITYLLNDEAGSGIWQDDGYLEVHFRNIDGSAAGSDTSGIYWENGQGFFRGNMVHAGSGAAIQSGVNATPTGDFYVAVEELQGEIACLFYGSDTAAAVWIEAKTVRGTVAQAGSNRIYIHTQKLFGRAYNAADGLLYIVTDKWAAVEDDANYIFFNSLSGTSFLTVTHYDPITYSGPAISVGGGNLEIRGGSCVGGATMGGISQAGGTLRLLQDVRIDTSANSSASPITKSGGTTVLGSGTALLAHSTRESISAATSQVVKVYGTAVANRAYSSNVTLQVGDIVMDTNVV